MKKIMTLSVCIIGFCASVFGFDINHNRGYWIGADAKPFHWFDAQLSEKLGKFFLGQGSETIVDFGCGMGDYVHTLQQMGLACAGYDGNPNTEELTKGLCQVLDLTEPFDLGKQFDWVLSLEVAEHIPLKYEKIYLDNLVRHAKEGIIMSWALKGQTGAGHCNTQDNDYVREKMAAYGFETDEVAEKMLRRSCDVHWFRATLMVFRRKS